MVRRGVLIPESELQEIARSAPRRIRGELVFSDADGGALDRNTMSKQVKAAMVRAGIPDASAHSLRHTFASRLAARGVPMQAIADLLGQNVARTTARYMHLQPEHLKQAMAALRRPAPKLHGSSMAVDPSYNS